MKGFDGMLSFELIEDTDDLTAEIEQALKCLFSIDYWLLFICA
ncbi:hypothetical protein D1BOALGB6SA_6373 [Olavius sp. associated proteobacterium Delta 1]|nr:hypothetical protein D1BOALGB6SA_6373 [Olavius sp. associated proteobacterium Delta 1]